MVTKTWQEVLEEDSPSLLGEKNYIAFEKRRVLSRNTPLPHPSLLEKFIYGVKRAVLSLIPAECFYNRTMKIRGY